MSLDRKHKRFWFWLFMVPLFLTALVPGITRSLIHFSSADRFLSVERLEVPSHVTAHNPTVLYQRTIHWPFYATWFVTTRRVSDNVIVRECTGHNVTSYEPGQNKKKIWMLDEFSGTTTCRDLLPGCYYLHVVWYMTIASVPKIQTKDSPPFCIYDKEGRDTRR